MSERTRLQQWVKELDRTKDWVVWKVEDKYRPGLPDVVMKNVTTGRVSWLELKWRTDRHVRKRTNDFKTGLTPDQRAHLTSWGHGAHLLLVSEPHATAWLVPAASLPGVDDHVTPSQLTGLSEGSCPAVKSAVQSMLNNVLR